MTRTDTDGSNGDDALDDNAPESSGGRSWIADELQDCGVPDFGLDQWLYHFMEDALQPDIPDEKLLTFFCLARDKALSDDPGFVSILERTEALLYSRMGDGASLDGEDGEVQDYRPDTYADALEAMCAGTLSGRHLVELFDLAATLRNEPGVGHMWQTVMFLSRMQILWRIRNARLRKNAGDGELHADNSTFVSERDALRVAEDALHPGISDAQLLEVYVLAKECGGMEAPVFDEIAESASAMVFGRMRQGTPDPHLDRVVPGFDYPDHGPQALKAVLKGDLPHQNLLMLYRLTWPHGARDKTWTAVSDLCRAQILRRMTPPRQRGDGNWDEWRRLELTRRLLASRN